MISHLLHRIVATEDSRFAVTSSGDFSVMFWDIQYGKVCYHIPPRILSDIFS